MKTVLQIVCSVLLLTFTAQKSHAQNTYPWPASGRVGIATTTPDASAILDLDTTGMGLLIPRMNQAKRDAIVSPATGLLIFQVNNSPGFYYYDGTKWTAVSAKGVNKSLSNLTAPTAINQSLLPGTSSTLDLGSATNLWNNLFINGDIYHAGKRIFSVAGTNNVFAGFFSGVSTTGANNTIIGNRAGNNNTTGGNNVFLGNAAGYNNLAQNGLVFIGDSAGYSSSSSGLSGSGNIFIGQKSGFATVGGFSNTAVGYNSFLSNTDGINNTALGIFSLQSNTITNSNVAIGSYALSGFNSGNFSDGLNTAIGDHAMQFTSSGARNVAIGYGALSSNSSTTGTGSNNISIGANSLRFNTSGRANLAIGNAALGKSTTSADNIAIGDSASYNYTGAVVGNIAIGTKALFADNTGYSNVALGFAALTSNTNASANTALGSEVLYANTTGQYNTGTGSSALKNNSTGDNNTANGFASLFSNTTGSNNTAYGYESNSFNTTGSYNTTVGIFALYKNTAGSELVAIGDSALYSLNGGLGGNTAVGSKAGKQITTGNYSTYIGWKAGYNSTAANANTAVGASSLFSNTTGYDNIAVGVDALSGNNTGSYNTIIGKGAGTTNSGGSGNASLGVRSLYLNTTGSRNTALGDSSGYTNNGGNNNSFLGAYADVTTGGLSNATAIGYSAKVSTSSTIVLGDATAGVNVAIGGTTAGVYKLKVLHSTYGFDIANASTLDNWEHYITGSSGTTSGGASFTAGDMLLYYDGGSSPLGAFDHTSGAYKTTSDERMKTNIKPMPSILDKINLLEPVTYNFKNSKNQNISMGFIAQKVEKLFPSLVTHYVDTARGTDVNLMDYTGFGVIAIKGIQELQQVAKQKDSIINNQQKQIDDLKSLMKQLQQSVLALQLCSPCSNQQSAIGSQQVIINNNDALSLEQNAPNPFNKSTVIRYTLPSKFATAQIVIIDNNGKILKQVNVSGTGKGSLNIDAGTLSSGAYKYSLLVDGKLVNTKTMVLTK